MKKKSPDNPFVEKAPVDWEAVEGDYRAGILSLRAIGKLRGCSAGRVAQVAKEKGWHRDLSAKIKAAAEARLNTDPLNIKLNTKSGAAACLDNEKAIIEANAEAIANIVRGHRSDTIRLRAVVTLLLEQVEVILSNPDMFNQLGEICAKPDEFGADKALDLYRRVLALPAQTEIVKRLAETLKLLIDLERRIFKIENTPEDSGDEAAEVGAHVTKGVQAALSALDLRIAAIKQTQ